MARKKVVKRKPKKLPIYAGVQMTAIGEKQIVNPHSTNMAVFYRCSFEDGSWRMIAEEVLKGFVKQSK